jgi:hypothetical protein
MANTTTINWPFITVVLDGSTDWTLSATGDAAGSTTKLSSMSETGLKLNSIRFHPSAAGDIMVVHENGLDGADIFYAECSAGTSDKVQYYNGAWVNPLIDASDLTLSSAAGAKITFHVM